MLSSGFDDSFEDFANRIQFDGTLAAVPDDDYDPRDFEWSSDEKESDRENLSEEEVKPTKRRKGKVSELIRFDLIVGVSLQLD